MQSSTANREVAFLLAAGTPVRESGSMCATRALEFLVSKFRESSRRSPGLIPQNATAWASDPSSCAKRSEFWATASTSPPFPAAGPAFPFSWHARRRGSEGGRATHEEGAQPGADLTSASEAIPPRGLAAHLRNQKPIPHWNK